MIARLLVASSLVCVAASAAFTVGAQSRGTTWAIQGGQVVTLAGPVLDHGTIVIRDGRIVSVGDDPAPPDAQIVDARGLHVYPGFFDAMSQLGLTEIGQVTPTVDTTDVGEHNPHLVALTAVHPASELLPVARSDGITHALSAPGSFGGRGASSVIPGYASVIHLAGWTVEEMAVSRTAALVLVWPAVNTGVFDAATFTSRERPFAEAKREADRQIASLAQLFADARHYARAAATGRTGRDLRLEALGPVLERRVPVLILAQREGEIRQAMAFAEAQGLRMILAGGAEAWKVKADLAEKRVPVILGPALALPTHEDDPYDKPLSRAGELHAAGVKVAMATFNASDSRTLPFEIGNAVAHGLPWVEGVKAITRNPAEMLGLDDSLGTIEAGKVANLVVTSGDPLEFRTRVVHVFVNGQPVPRDNRHEELYQRYRGRPRPTP